MRLRWAIFVVAVLAATSLTATAAFAATIQVDSAHKCGFTGTVYPTIQQGVNAASAGSTVKVCGEPAPYAGATVSTPGVRLVGLNKPVVEQPGGNALTLSADKVSVSGFEIRNSGAAIVTLPQFSGYTISNNNLHDNSIGIYLGSDGTFRTIITGNNIHDNNAAGAGQGNGIDSETPLSLVTISNNQFVNNDNAGVLINPQSGADSGITISLNSFSGELNSDVAFLQTVNNSQIVQNTMSNPVADPVNGGSSIFIGGDSHQNIVDHNTIKNPNYNGIAVRDTAHDIRVTENQITGAGHNGIDVSSTAPGAVNADGNGIAKSTQIGINFQAGTTGSSLRSIHSTGSAGPFNCQDLGTNTWAESSAAPSNPAGICH